MFPRRQAFEELLHGSSDKPVYRDVAHLGVFLESLMQAFGEADCGCHTLVGSGFIHVPDLTRAVPAGGG